MSENTNIPKSVEIMRKISSKEFSSYFYRNIYPKVSKYERWRPAVYCLNTILTVLFVVLWLSLQFEQHNMDFIMILIVLMIVALVLRIITPSMKKMQQQMKFEILPLLLNFTGCDFVVNDYGAGGSSGNPFLDKIKDTFTFRIFNEKSPYNAAQEYEYKNTRLFDYFNICKTDDRITGNYNSIPLELSDIDLKHESGSGKNHRVVQVFKGLLIKFPMNKEFTGNIIVKKDTLKLLGDSENRVHLEDPVFEKYFDVYADNQIEARYILTTGFMERLVNIAAKNRKCKVSCSFIDGYMYIALDGKDWFDIPASKSFKEIGSWQRVLVDFIDIFRILDELKVEQNIGM